MRTPAHLFFGLILSLGLLVSACDGGHGEDEGCGEEELVSCPTGVLHVAGDEVVRGTTLEFDSTWSSPVNASIERWRWSAIQPDGGEARFQPSPLHPSPTFTPDMAGTYTFELQVTDENGQESCEPAMYIVVVRPSAWVTPSATQPEGEVATSRDVHGLQPISPTHDDVNFFNPQGSNAP